MGKENRYSFHSFSNSCNTSNKTKTKKLLSFCLYYCTNGDNIF